MLDRTLTVTSGSDQLPVTDYTDDTDWEASEFGMSANGGNASACSVIIRDESGVIPDYQGQRFLFGHNVVRATVGSNTLFRGRIAGHEASRGQAAVAREHEFSVDLEDQNSHLGGIVVHNWVRPAETDKQRVQGLIAAYLSGNPRVTTNLNGSNYVSSSNTVSLPAKTFSGVFPVDILREIASNADKEMFVTVDNEMFYDGHDSTAYQSLLRISDDPADANATTYAPWEPTGSKASRDVTSHLRVYYGSDTIQQSTQSSNAGVSPEYDYWEDIYWDSESTTAAQSIARADKMLAAASTAEETYACAIGPMNGDQIYKIKVGQTIQFKSRAARSGRLANGQYIGDSFRVVRIRELRWEMPAVDTYIAHLRLDRWRPFSKSKGSQALTTQGPPGGDLVASCACIETFTRNESGTLGTSELNGRQWQNDPAITDETGYALTVDGSVAKVDWASASSAGNVDNYINVEGVQNRPFEMLVKIRADGGPGGAGMQLNEDESQMYLGIGTGPLSYVAGVSPPLAQAFVRLTLLTSETTCSIKGNFRFEDDTNGPAAIAAETTLLTYANDSVTGEWFWIRFLVSHNTGKLRGWLDSGAEPSTWDLTFNNVPTQDWEISSEVPNRFEWWAVGGDANDHNIAWNIDYIEVISGLWCCTYAAQTGQWFPEEQLGYGDGATTLFHIPISDAYVPGTLRVWVDGLEQTAAVAETNPAAGTFTFSFTPESTELISCAWRVA